MTGTAIFVAAAVAAGLVAGCSKPAVSGRVADTASRPVSASHATASPQSPSASAATGTHCSGGGQGVSDAGELSHALASARPGQVISLAPGSYLGHFTATVSGKPSAPITLCGPRSAVLDGGGLDHGYVLHLSSVSWMNLTGFSVRDGQKGIVLDGSSHDVLSDLAVSTIGDEAVHFRAFSSDDVLSNSVITDTGHHSAKFGEGVYIGSAHKNWCSVTSCEVDRSDRNLISHNTIAATTAENIDLKEGTSGGQIIGNQLSGKGIVGSAASAWINVKGNGWTILDNVGRDSPEDGFQVHQVFPGWGEQNVFRDNSAFVNGPGVGYYVQHTDLQTLVACSNKATGAGSGLSNVTCTPGG